MPRKTRPGFFGALKDAVEAVQDYVRPRTEQPKHQGVPINDTIDRMSGYEEKKRRQHRVDGNEP